MRECEALAVLVSVPGVSYAQREMSLRRAGSALAVLENPAVCAPMLGESGVSALRRMKQEGRAERMLEDLARQGIALVMRGEPGYPRRLMQIANPPHLLFVQGEPNLDDPFPFAVVGTRRASAYGVRHTQEIAHDLAKAGMCIVSGLAIGIDTAGHRGALAAGGRTVAVLGGALDRLYPAGNRPLLHEILEAGGSVVTEYPMGVPPGRYTFLHRNRIIAGMCLGVLVTEGAYRSGALSTVQEALDAGREVFAMPGSVESEGSQLPHMLIREGAHLTTDARDILELVQIDAVPMPGIVRPAEAPHHVLREEPPPKRAKRETCAPPPGLSPQEEAVYRALLSGEMDFDALCQETGIASEELGAVLMMDMDGLVKAMAGCRYALIS